MIDFIIIGAQKAGTTAAIFNLNKHPGIDVFSSKTEYGQLEIEFFNQHWIRGVEWYKKQLPESNLLIGEKTAELLHRTICHERIFLVQPNVKLIVLLRSPIERAYSQWRMAYLNKKDEHRSFDEVIQTEIKLLENNLYKEEFYQCTEKGISCWREGYLIKGLYNEQLESLFKIFPTDNIHISISERIIKNKNCEYNKIFSFLNLDSLDTFFEEKFIGQITQSINIKTYNLLKDFYNKPNENLFNMLGYEINEWF